MLFHLDSSQSATLMPLVQCVQWTGEKTEYWGWVDFGPVLSRFWTKVHKISRQCRGPLTFCNVLARLSLSCFVQKIFAIKSWSRRKLNKCKFFWPLALNFLGGTTRTFLWQIVSTIYCSPFANVWLSSICRSSSAKPGNEVECRIYGG